jgi:hypothetical protein
MKEAEKDVLEFVNGLFKEHDLVSKALETEKLIELETDKLLLSCELLQKQILKWQTIEKELNGQVKELGDLEQFASSIEKGVIELASGYI